MNNDDRNRDYSLLLYSLSYIPPLNVIFRAYLLLKSRWKPPWRCHHQLINRTPLILLNSSCDTVFLGKKKKGTTCFSISHSATGFKLSSCLVLYVEQDGMWQTDLSVTTSCELQCEGALLNGYSHCAGLPEGLSQPCSANPRTAKRLNYGWCLAKLILAVCFIVTPYLVFRIPNILFALCIAK